MMNDWIQNEVRSLIERFGTRDPFELCDALGIRVIRYPLPEQIEGFSLRCREETQIFLNDRLDRFQKATCAHELGHLRLHPSHNAFFLRDCTCCVAGRYEREADRFALFLLLPEEEWDAASRDDCRALAARYSLPPRLLSLLWPDAAGA